MNVGLHKEKYERTNVEFQRLPEAVRCNNGLGLYGFFGGGCTGFASLVVG